MNISSYASLRQQLLAGTTSCSNVVEHYLKNIKLNEHLNAFLEVFETGAIERAAYLDEQIEKGNAGKLTGMVIGLKDNICYKGHKVSAASKILEGFESLYSSTAVERLAKEGAIFIGRLMHLPWAVQMKIQHLAQLKTRTIIQK
jgi:aspartyl-tRNA(Asn)/glutamyl-tRNA(Gln) amidotransferase subunit A